MSTSSITRAAVHSLEQMVQRRFRELWERSTMPLQEAQQYPQVNWELPLPWRRSFVIIMAPSGDTSLYNSKKKHLEEACGAGTFLVLILPRKEEIISFTEFASTFSVKPSQIVRWKVRVIPWPGMRTNPRRARA